MAPLRASSQKGDCHFKELGHTAEVGLRVEASSQAELYACAARGLFWIIGAEPDPRALPIVEEIRISGLDPENLMVDWLNELLLLSAPAGLVMSDCRMASLSHTYLNARVEFVRPRRSPALEVKAVTYHQISVKPQGERWLADVYFDI
jgi:SHS2 domain-containing protein